jgi:NAD(P)H dehydrogenase (quinone)
MKHAVIVCHPNPDSLTCSAAMAFADAVVALGQQVVVRDLYRMDFDPCLKASEIPRPAGYVFCDDVVVERELLDDVNAFVLVYPLWFNSPPAMIKGYIERVFGMGFGFAPGLGGTEPLLEGRKLLSITFSGAPEEWLQETGALKALSSIFDHHVARMCGLQVLEHVHCGGIVANMNPEAVEEILDRVRFAVHSHFGELARSHAA